MRSLGLCCLALVIAWPTRGEAQSSPFVSEPLFRQLVNELSGDRAFESVRHLTHYHRPAGSPGFFSAAEWIRDAADAAGLEDVKLVRQSWSGHGWSCRFAEAWLVAPEEQKLADYAALPIHVADHSRTTHVTAELVDVDEGLTDADYEKRPVKGRIVLASGELRRVHEEAVWRRGALGVVSYQTNRDDMIDAPDQVAWAQLPYEARKVAGVGDGTAPGFAVMISPRAGRRLSRWMADSGETFTLKVDIDAPDPAQSEQAMVEAWIRGTEISDQQVVLTAHVQEEKTSANDNASGCASMLEIGRTLARLVREGRIPRPRRDIRFWWVNELSSQPRYFRENPDQARKMLVNISQDMVGARQSWGGRVQYASRLPWSLPHALDDVMESVLTMVRDGNTDLLALRGTRSPHPFAREITAVTGSREPFHARMVPYFGSTDHHCFTQARIGVPGTSLTNWPDRWIHSSGDDLHGVDATQLERNAVVVAAVAWYFAALSDTQIPTLAAYMSARGRARIAADAATAVAHLAGAAASERPAALRQARNLTRQAYARELRNLAGLRRLTDDRSLEELFSDLSAALGAGQSLDLAQLDSAYQAMAGQPAGRVELSKEERGLASRRYVPVPDLGGFQDAMRQVRGRGRLHRLMAFEVYNFADGRRTALEVYEAVAAEALAAGAWYYGEVRPADVLAALERARKAGAYTLEDAR